MWYCNTVYFAALESFSYNVKVGKHNVKCCGNRCDRTYFRDSMQADIGKFLCCIGDRFKEQCKLYDIS